MGDLEQLMAWEKPGHAHARLGSPPGGGGSDDQEGGQLGPKD